MSRVEGVLRRRGNGASVMLFCRSMLRFVARRFLRVKEAAPFVVV